MTQPIDTLHRYLFDNYEVRGELVQLQQSYQQVLASQHYPAPVQRLLGELLTATSLLTATLKFEGHINVQLQGDGPVSLVVVNGDNAQQLRGIARWEGDIPDTDNLAELMGKGYLAITITPNDGERYQGIVELGQDSLSKSIESYFAQSEQLKTRIWLFTDPQLEQPQCAGILLQALPNVQEGDFEHLEALTHTIKAQELLSLEAHEILYRLYHQDSVRVFDPQPVSFLCSCSREKCEQALLQLGEAEATDVVTEEGKIEMNCDYCGQHYHFNLADLQTLFKAPPTIH
ncbi:MAG: Hsp33 family molecular chaperone HslO [Oceanisphaera sp.]|uniref:Hsp33 family molecular chaperone HslO n=1 Tax=Oceanisphaera sp. TaxID=1929979 RepID=UPI003F9E0382